MFPNIADLQAMIQGHVKKITLYIQGVPKKNVVSWKIAITTLKLIQNANVGGVLENSGYLLPHGH